MLGTHTFLVNLLDEGHDELRFYDNGVVFTVTIYHVHGIQPVPPTCGNMNHRANVAHCLHQRGVLAFRITHKNIILGVQHQECHKLLCAERLSGTRNTQQESGLVQQIFLVAHNQVVGDRVLAKVNAALVHDLLHLKGHEHGNALSGQGSEGIDLACADGQNRVQTVHLLILKNCHLAHPFPGCGKNGFRIRV